MELTEIQKPPPDMPPGWAVWIQTHLRELFNAVRQLLIGIYVSEDGKVGIGTSSPDGKLDVMQTISGLTTGLRFSAHHTPGVVAGGIIDAYDDGGTVRGLTLQNNGGNVGFGTTTPTIAASTKEKCGMTAIGGFAVKLTNKTGVNSVAGKLVRADTTTDDAVKLTVADEEETFGIFLESGVSDGDEAWIVISGIADVAMEDNTTATRGNWVRSSITDAGYADATNTTPPSPAAFSHFDEIGNCIETVTATGGGTHILARCVLHFN